MTHHFDKEITRVELKEELLNLAKFSQSELAVYDLDYLSISERELIKIFCKEIALQNGDNIQSAFDAYYHTRKPHISREDANIEWYTLSMDKSNQDRNQKIIQKFEKMCKKGVKLDYVKIE